MSVSEPVVATSAQEPEPELLPTAQQPRDAWGNTILSEPGPMGQYRIRSARDGRILRVCGEASSQKHLLWWDYDESERRCVCGLCWRLTPAPDGEQVGETDDV